jgi:uncharacterized membrane protein
MAKKPVAAAADVPAAFTEADFAAHERTYHSFLSVVKLSILSMALLVIGLYFVLFGGAPIFGGFVILASLIVPPVLAVWQRT